MSPLSIAGVSLCVFLASSAGALGCALTDKAEVLDVHYYAAEMRPAAGAPEPTSPGATGGDVELTEPPLLRLGRVSTGAHLGKKIVYRSSSVELGMYDDRRWTERPDEYVRRSLSGALFDTRRATQSLAGAATTLDVELLAFEEVRQQGETRKGRVSIRYALHDEQRVLVSDVMTVEVDVASDEASKVVLAISQALAQTTERIAERVSVRLDEANRTAER